MYKLKALVDGTNLVRAELTGERMVAIEDQVPVSISN
jgi:hypothetical protein